MNAKHVLFVAIVVALLAPMVAVPVLAEQDDAPAMWVHRLRPRYTGRRLNPGQVHTKVHIRDATLDMVEGAEVTAVWTLPDGTVMAPRTDLTNDKGIADFAVWAGSGYYKICVVNVTAAGRLWDPALDREVCPILKVP